MVQHQDVLEPWIFGFRVQLQDFGSFCSKMGVFGNMCPGGIHMVPKANMCRFFVLYVVLSNTNPSLLGFVGGEKYPLSPMLW
jgi:hypothetical protein